MRNHLCNFSIALLLSLSTAQVHAEESYGDPEDPVVAEVLGMQIRTKSPVEMQYVIGEKLFQNHARQNKIEASQEDVDLYMTKMDQFMRDDPHMRDERNKREAEIEAKKIAIQQQLKTGTILQNKKSSFN